jgi:hypothetical protein
MRCLGKKLSGDQNYHPTEFIRIEICSIINWLCCKRRYIVRKIGTSKPKWRYNLILCC